MYKLKSWIKEERLDWTMLSENPRAIRLLEHCELVKDFKQPIFEYDYEGMSQQRHDLNHELLAASKESITYFIIKNRESLK